MRVYSIALDGPSGAGKSTLARLLARRFGFTYVDTGAIYRSVGLLVFRRGVDPKDCDRVAALLPEISIALRHEADGAQRVELDGEDVTEEIRRHEISMYASDVSAHPPVRAFLLEMQRDFARVDNVIMDGRDIGTVVLPGASLKIFLTASPEKRAERRHRELLEKGADTPYSQVLEDIRTRDKNDSSRASAPLRPAEDAVIVDTTDMSLGDSLEALTVLVRDRLGLKEVLR